jgi:hypothetical protein
MPKPYSELNHSNGKLYWITGQNAGKEAGSQRKDGYRKVEYKGKLWLTHRLIWKIVFGEEPAMLDHINGNRSDNRVENLRVCSRQGNTANTPIKTRFRGVYKHQGKYKSSISISEKTIHLGVFDLPNEAAFAYNEAAKKYYGEFATFNMVFEDADVTNEFDAEGN